MKKSHILGLFTVALIIPIFYFSATTSAATAWTIGAGEDFVSITAAIADGGVLDGDTLNITTNYDESDVNESYPLVISKELTIDCADAETLGDIDNNDEIQITDINVTISNCELDYVYIHVYTSDFTLDSNTVDTNAVTYVNTASDNADNMAITNNTGLNGVEANNELDGTNISDNTFEIRFLAGGVRYGINSTNGNSSNTTVSGNTLTWYETTLGGNAVTFIGTSGDSVDITNNILNFDAKPDEISTGYVLLAYGGGDGSTITGNYISYPSGVTTDSYAAIQVMSSGTESTSSTIQNNTIEIQSAVDGFAMQIQHANGDDYTMDVDIQYNVIYSDTDLTGAEINGMLIENQNDNYMMTVTEDYNGSYNITRLYNISEGNSGFTLIQPGNSYENVNPVMMSEDAGSANDMQPYPASCYFEVNGDLDIGAYGNPTGTDRTRTAIYVDDIGTPDYNATPPAIDFNTINTAIAAMCPSASTQPVNTLDIAAGTYLEQVRFENMDGITVTGAGSGSTTIDSTATGTNATLGLQNTDNSSVSGFTLIAAATDPAALSIHSSSDGNTITDVILSGATTITTVYTATRHPYTYNGNDYVENGVYFTHDDSGVPNDDFIWSSTTDDFPITDGIASTPQTWNLGLASNGGTYYTFYAAETERLDSSTIMFDTASALDTYLDGLGAGDFDVECWADDVFVWDGGSYDYTAPAGCAAGDPTLTAGYQTSPSTPAINFSQGGTLLVASSDSNNISSSTVQNATNGISFTGTAASNTIGTNMTFTSNTTDIKTFSTGDNTVTTSDYCATLNYLVASTGKLLGCNSTPTITGLSASQTSGENRADVGVRIDDPDNDEVSLQVQYGFYTGNDCANTTEWTNATITSTISPVDTLNGSSTLAFIWSIISESIATSDGTYCLKVTATDDDNFTTNSSTTIGYTYQEPQVSTDGGTSFATRSSGSTESKKEDTAAEIDDEETDDKDSGGEAVRISFSDTKGHGAEDEINKLIDEDVILGYGDGTFKPNDKLNRVEAAIFLYRLLEDEAPKSPTVKPFPDVDIDEWYAGYISDLKGKGIVDGYGDGEFKPKKEINYAEFTKMLLYTYSYKAEEETQTEIEELLEGKDNGAWYVPSVDVSTTLGLIEESSNVEEKISRGEAVIILHDVFFGLTD